MCIVVDICDTLLAAADIFFTFPPAGPQTKGLVKSLDFPTQLGLPQELNQLPVTLIIHRYRPFFQNKVARFRLQFEFSSVQPLQRARAAAAAHRLPCGCCVCMCIDVCVLVQLPKHCAPRVYERANVLRRGARLYSSRSKATLHQQMFYDDRCKRQYVPALRNAAAKA